VSDPVAPGRLVIVDDEPVILQLLTTIFADDRYDLVACADGTSALEAIGQGCDVLLTDKNLPDVGGLELVRAAKQRDPDAEAIILTGYASLDTALEAMELDVYDYIVKPPKDIFDIRRRVRQAFDKQRVVRENRRLLAQLKQKNAELERSIAELTRAQQELIQSEKLAGIGTLAAGVAHEISSPLFGILGLAEAIAEEDDLDVVRGYGSEIVDYSRIIKDIVVDLTSYTRSADREYLTTIDVRQVLHDAVRLVLRSIGAAQDGVPIEAPAGLHVHARTSELQQVFVNLVKNALEAVQPTGGTVRVHAADDGEGGVVIKVIDDGPGVPAGARTQIFDPFYTTKDPGKGTGLGLNIVYRIVTKHRGHVLVEETPGGGATFVVHFPAETA
jgi:C4-dicarboxylate-specific signal transduction histidine kinase